MLIVDFLYGRVNLLHSCVNFSQLVDHTIEQPIEITRRIVDVVLDNFYLPKELFLLDFGLDSEFCLVRFNQVEDWLRNFLGFLGCVLQLGDEVFDLAFNGSCSLIKL